MGTVLLRCPQRIPLGDAHRQQPFLLALTQWDCHKPASYTLRSCTLARTDRCDTGVGVTAREIVEEATARTGTATEIVTGTGVAAEAGVGAGIVAPAPLSGKGKRYR